MLFNLVLLLVLIGFALFCFVYFSDPYMWLVPLPGIFIGSMLVATPQPSFTGSIKLMLASRYCAVASTIALGGWTIYRWLT